MGKPVDPKVATVLEAIKNLPGGIGSAIRVIEGIKKGLNTNVDVPAVWPSATTYNSPAIARESHRPESTVKSTVGKELGTAAAGLAAPAVIGTAPAWASTLIPELASFEAINQTPRIFGGNSVTGYGGQGAEWLYRKAMPDGEWEDALAPYVNGAGQFAAGLPLGVASHFALSGAKGLGKEAVNAIRKEVAAGKKLNELKRYSDIAKDTGTNFFKDAKTGKTLFLDGKGNEYFEHNGFLQPAYGSVPKKAEKPHEFKWIKDDLGMPSVQLKGLKVSEILKNIDDLSNITDNVKVVTPPPVSVPSLIVPGNNHPGIVQTSKTGVFDAPKGKMPDIKFIRTSGREQVDDVLRRVKEGLEPPLDNIVTDISGESIRIPDYWAAALRTDAFKEAYPNGVDYWWRGFGNIGPKWMEAMSGYPKGAIPDPNYFGGNRAMASGYAGGSFQPLADVSELAYSTQGGIPNMYLMVTPKGELYDTGTSAITRHWTDLSKGKNFEIPGLTPLYPDGSVRGGGFASTDEISRSLYDIPKNELFDKSGVIIRNISDGPVGDEVIWSSKRGGFPKVVHPGQSFEFNLARKHYLHSDGGLLANPYAGGGPLGDGFPDFMSRNDASRAYETGVRAKGLKDRAMRKELKEWEKGAGAQLIKDSSLVRYINPLDLNISYIPEDAVPKENIKSRYGSGPAHIDIFTGLDKDSDEFTSRLIYVGPDGETGGYIYLDPLTGLNEIYENYIEDASNDEDSWSYSSGGRIHIKPSHRGKFTALLKRTGKPASWFKAHGTPAQKKMATFALNARKWKHEDGGPLNLYPSGGRFITTLTPDREEAFMKDWQAYANLNKLDMNPDNPEHYYDYRGFWDANKKSSVVNPFIWETKSTAGHLPDTWKTPGHPTFSVESVYAKDAPALAGSWENGFYVAPPVPDAEDMKRRQWYAESSFRDGLTSSAGAMGRYQIMPITYKEYTQKTGKTGDLMDPVFNEGVRDWYIDSLGRYNAVKRGNPNPIVKEYRRYVAYNMGPGALNKVLDKAEAMGMDIDNSIEWLDLVPKESRDYANFIVGRQDVADTAKTNAKYEAAWRAYNQKKCGGIINKMRKAYGGDIIRMRDAINKAKGLS